MEFHPREAIDLMVNFSAVCSQIDSDPIIVALEKDCRPEFSPVFIKMINKDCSGWNIWLRNISYQSIEEKKNEKVFGKKDYAIKFITSLSTVSLILVRRLEFFIKITKRGNDLLHSIFYMNDLKVMTHVVARELINNESLQV